MPSPHPIPTIHELTGAFHMSVRARRDKRADGRAGSAYDYVADLSAILWSRHGVGLAGQRKDAADAVVDIGTPFAEGSLVSVQNTISFHDDSNMDTIKKTSDPVPATKDVSDEQKTRGNNRLILRRDTLTVGRAELDSGLMMG